VHCHDLLALRSALGLVPENPTRWSGRLYQRWIYRGLRRARHFISISEASRADLHRHAGVRPALSAVVPNGLNHPYRRIDAREARARLAAAGLPAPPAAGLLLHVGGGQWYKNTAGVVALYGALARQPGAPRPALWMVSPPPDAAVRAQLAALPAHAEVRFLHALPAPLLEALYSLADALLFPSLAEGFGWPIAEALACGCPVLTTGEAPMNEVGGMHAHYLPRLAGAAQLPLWAEQGAQRLAALLQRPAEQRARAALAAMAWARRYDAGAALDAMLALYAEVLAAAPRAPRPALPLAGSPHEPA
jgi:glycosyltransferase involved in cell wall biosynthesis